MVSMMRVPELNCSRAMLRTRRTSLRKKKIAGGATMRPPSDMIGSCVTITITRPISDIRSRPMAVMSRLITDDTALAPVVIRAMNSDECRSAKKLIFSCRSLSNMRR